jgi:hypothetical protein
MCQRSTFEGQVIPQIFSIIIISTTIAAFITTIAVFINNNYNNNDLNYNHLLEPAEGLQCCWNRCCFNMADAIRWMRQQLLETIQKIAPLQRCVRQSRPSLDRQSRLSQPEAEASRFLRLM